MYRSISFSAFLSLVQTISAGQGQSSTGGPLQQPQLQTQHIHITAPKTASVVNIHNTPQFSNYNQNQGSMDNQMSSTNTNALYSVSQLYNSVQARFENFLSQHNIQLQQLAPRELANRAQSYLMSHKKQTFFVTIGLIYTAVSGALISYHYRLQKPQTWCSWKKHLSVEELHECTHQELQQNLREAILHRYLNKKTKDRLTSYMQFMNQVEKEEKMIKRYLAIAEMVKKSSLMRLFPVSDTKIEQVKDKKQRLAFVKHIFISWAAQQNFEKV